MAANDSLAEQFVQIKKTIEDNCADCYGASREDFVQAVKALEALIGAGYAEPAAATLLAQSYRTWALVYSNDKPEEKALLGKEERLYADLVQEYPNDTQLLLAYASALSDPIKRLAVLQRAETLVPDDPQIQYTLGMLYAHGLDDPKNGVIHLERAVKFEPTYTKLLYGEQLARVLEMDGHAAEAEKVRSDMKSFEQELQTRDRLKQVNKQGS
jgi:tetratricopeptide (TPR) repeat protein